MVDKLFQTFAVRSGGFQIILTIATSSALIVLELFRGE